MGAIPLSHFLYIGAFLFCAGLWLLLTKRNAVMMLIGVELVLNAANINLVAFSQYDPQRLQGQAMALFVLVVAAAEAAVALAIVLQIYRHYQSTNLDELS